MVLESQTGVSVQITVPGLQTQRVQGTLCYALSSVWGAPGPSEGGGASSEWSGVSGPQTLATGLSPGEDTIQKHRAIVMSYYCVISRYNQRGGMSDK